MAARSAEGRHAAGHKQCAELTFKHNLHAGRHGWLRLTPAYSVRVVEELLAGLTSPVAVCDPFSGTATTPLCAAMHGHRAVALEINPFLAWFGKVKVSHHDPDVLAATDDAGRHASHLASKAELVPATPPPIFNIERWWSRDRLEYLCRLKAAIDAVANERSSIRDLLNVAFCRTLIRLSNAAFNHQSMSFKTEAGIPQLQLWDDDQGAMDCFGEDIALVLRGAALNPKGDASVILGDARKTCDFVQGQFDLLITSPPYPNRMSYIRELRPYMYWLGYLQQSREAGEMDWKAIGGTWGIATSRLADWQRSSTAFFPNYLLDLLQTIATSDTKSGQILANYVGKYCEDMWQHFVSIRAAMKTGASLHYIVGNSKFYDVIVPVERIYRDMLAEAGFKSPGIRTLRKRNSKKELLEFEVFAHK